MYLLVKPDGARWWRFDYRRTKARTMSENTVNAALCGLGFDKDTMTGYGFRAMASTRLNEMGCVPDVVERQRAHAERTKHGPVDIRPTPRGKAEPVEPLEL